MITIITTITITIMTMVTPTARAASAAIITDRLAFFQTQMDICDQIRSERRAGKTRCGVVEGRMTIAEAAQVFGLAGDSAIYREINRPEADAIATRVLCADLAYGCEIMGMASAVRLWQQFIALFDAGDMKFATNVGSLNSWNPATSATFDMGILVIGFTKAGCLWVEDED